jgi:hypothetical protein
MEITVSVEKAKTVKFLLLFLVIYFFLCSCAPGDISDKMSGHQGPYLITDIFSGILYGIIDGLIFPIAIIKSIINNIFSEYFIYIFSFRNIAYSVTFILTSLIMGFVYIQQLEDFLGFIVRIKRNGRFSLLDKFNYIIVKVDSQNTKSDDIKDLNLTTKEFETVGKRYETTSTYNMNTVSHHSTVLFTVKTIITGSIYIIFL